MKKFFSLAVAFIMLTAMNVFANDNYTSLTNPVHMIQQSVDVTSGWTDGGSTSGYIDLTPTIPAGAIPIAWRANVTTAFACDTTATMLVGISGDTDKFTENGAQSVAATGKVAGSALGQAEGANSIGSAQTVRVTVTEDSDFGDVTAGAATISIFYIRP
mgnify:FL=1